MSRWAMGRRWPVSLVALAGYGVLAAILTWPLVTRLGDRFPGQRPDDAYGHYWNLWWFKRAITSGQNPYQTSLWYPPDGVDLTVGTLAPINGLVGLLPSLVTSPLVVYNLLVLLNVTLAGWATFLLARRVSGHLGGAAVAGLMMAGSPYLIYQLNHGHLNVIALYGLPLFAYGLLRAADGSLRHIPVAGLAILETALAEWQTAVSALLVAGVLLASQIIAALRQRRPWGSPGRMVLAGLLGGLLVLPFALMTTRGIEAAGATARLGETVNRAGNVLAFVLPQGLHPWWGPAIYQWRQTHLWEPLTAGMMSLGLVGLALAIVGLARDRRDAGPWLVVLALGVALALGPVPHVGQTPVAMPTLYALLRELPYMDVSRNPSRYVVIADLGLAVLAALGVRWLATRPLARGRGGLVAGLLALVVLVELCPAPFTLTSPPDTEVAERIGREIAATDPEGAVLTLPYKSYEEYVLFHQVHHQRPIYSTGGSVPRLPEPPLRATMPGFTDLVRDRPERDLLQPRLDPLVALNALRVRYVLFYPREVPARELAGYQTRLRRVLQQPGPTYVAADGGLEAWRVPVVPVEPPFLRLGGGWQRAETWTGIGTGRWLREEGTLYLERPLATATTLSFTAVSFARPRTLEVRLDGALLAVVPVATTATPVTVEVPAGQGRAVLDFEAREGANPRDQEQFGDRRPLTIGLAEVQITAASRGE